MAQELYSPVLWDLRGIQPSPTLSCILSLQLKLTVLLLGRLSRSVVHTVADLLIKWLLGPPLHFLFRTSFLIFLP